MFIHLFVIIVEMDLAEIGAECLQPEAERNGTEDMVVTRIKTESKTRGIEFLQECLEAVGTFLENVFDGEGHPPFLCLLHQRTPGFQAVLQPESFIPVKGPLVVPG